MRHRTLGININIGTWYDQPYVQMGIKNFVKAPENNATWDEYGVVLQLRCT